MGDAVQVLILPVIEGDQSLDAILKHWRSPQLRFDQDGRASLRAAEMLEQVRDRGEVCFAYPYNRQQVDQYFHDRQVCGCTEFLQGGEGNSHLMTGRDAPDSHAADTFAIKQVYEARLRANTDLEPELTGYKCALSALLDGSLVQAARTATGRPTLR